MAAPAAPPSDYFAGSRPAPRTRPSASALPERNRVVTPGSPRTPYLGRSISSQFGSPGSAFRAEQEDHIVYELGARHLSAGFAGESRPRCSIRFTPEQGRRVGDYRQWEPGYRRAKCEEDAAGEGWGSEHQLYRTDVRGLDLGLVEDKLERGMRQIHVDYLQLDQKPRKAVLAVPSLLPTPILEIALRVLFNHYSQPPSVIIMTNPILATVSAGLRCSLTIEVGWEETVVTAVGEYKEVLQRRSVRAGKMLTQETAKMLQDKLSNGRNVGFQQAEEVTERMAWCRLRSDEFREGNKAIPAPAGTVNVPFQDLSQPAEDTLFASNTKRTDHDDHDAPIHHLAYDVLLALPSDLRALCVSRIIVTGGVSQVPGLKNRLLHEISQIIKTRGWDPVASYGSASAHHARVLQEHDANIARSRQKPPSPEVTFSPEKKFVQDDVPPSQRVSGDVHDPVGLKVQRNMGRQPEVVRAVVRGVETLGAWAGASLVASLRIKGVHEVEREEFLKSGMRDLGHAVF